MQPKWIRKHGQVGQEVWNTIERVFEVLRWWHTNSLGLMTKDEVAAHPMHPHILEALAAEDDDDVATKDEPVDNKQLNERFGYKQKQCIGCKVSMMSDRTTST
jgi:hypothetical protein